MPFEEFDLHLFASDRGLMATPTQCTLYPVERSSSPGTTVLSDQRSEVFVGLSSGPNGTPCPGQVRPFHPRLVAGTSNPIAGAFSDFHLKLDRDDGDQFLGDLNFRMPPGFTGDLSGISYCSEAAIAQAAQNLGRAEQASPSCPASSQIGTTNVAAGPGSHPFHAVGKMYLAGPLQGAPLSLVAITPALAGPYDYGVVVVRVALHVDPVTAQVSAASETMPQIIGGVPIRMRSIQVNIDRAQLHDQSDPLLILLGRLAGDRRPGHGHRLQLLLPRGELRKPRFRAEDDGEADRRKATARSRTPDSDSISGPGPGDANIKRSR